jgi:hypothetical protein
MTIHSLLNIMGDLIEMNLRTSLIISRLTTPMKNPRKRKLSTSLSKLITKTKTQNIDKLNSNKSRTSGNSPRMI